MEEKAKEANWSVKIGNKTYGNPALGRDPFSTRPDSFSNQIKGSEKGAVVGSWLSVIFLGGIFSLFFWHMHMPLYDKGVFNPPECLLGIFILFLLGKATWETVRLKRFGDPMLELNTVPVAPGGMIEGRINLGSNMNNPPDFSVTLACIHRVVTQGAKSSHTQETVLWSEEKKATVLLGGTLSISMAVPGDQPETYGTGSFDSYLWRLTVKAPFPLVPFLEKYEVPVYGSATTK